MPWLGGVFKSEWSKPVYQSMRNLTFDQLKTDYKNRFFYKLIPVHVLIIMALWYKKYN